MEQVTTQVTGTFGDIICYQSRGRYIVRSKGNTGRQAPEAKMQAAILGKASGLSARFRKAFTDLIPEPKNRRLMYRLNNAFQQWLKTRPMESADRNESVPQFNGFTFNENNPLGAVFNSTMPVWKNESNQYFLQVPQFDSANPVAPLPFDGVIDIKVRVARTGIDSMDEVVQTTSSLHIPYYGSTVPTQSLPIEVNILPGTLTLILVSVNGMAAGITAAIWGGGKP